MPSMEAQDSLQCSQQSTTDLCPKADQSNPSPSILFQVSFRYHLVSNLFGLYTRDIHNILG
jgi:hypothetical protein